MSTKSIGKIALHMAAESGTLEVVEFSLQQGISNLDALSFLRETPLHIAAERGHPGITHQLLLAGSNLNLRNRAGDTSLHAACRIISRIRSVPIEDRIATVRILMQFGANPHLLSGESITPMYQLIEAIDSPEMVIAIASFDPSCLNARYQEIRRPNSAFRATTRDKTMIDFAHSRRRPNTVRLFQALQLPSENPYIPDDPLEEDFVHQSRYRVYFALKLTQLLIAALI